MKQFATLSLEVTASIDTPVLFGRDPKTPYLGEAMPLKVVLKPTS